MSTPFMLCADADAGLMAVSSIAPERSCLAAIQSVLLGLARSNVHVCDASFVVGLFRCSRI